MGSWCVEWTGDRLTAKETAISTRISVEARVTDHHPAGHYETARVDLLACDSGRLFLQVCFPEGLINRLGFGCRLQTQHDREYLPTAAIHRHSF